MENPPAPNPYTSPPTPLDKYASRPTPVYSTLEEQIMGGERLILVPYVVSIVILSFRRHMGGVHVVREGEWPIGKLLGAALVTLLFGFWGVPFGILFSIQTLFYLARGGKDVTREVLEHALGAERAKEILAQAPKPKPPAGIWVVRLIALLPLILLILFIIYGAHATETPAGQNFADNGKFPEL